MADSGRVGALLVSGVEVEELSAEVRRVVAGARKGGAFEDLIERAGIDPASIPDGLEYRLTVTTRQSGLDSDTIELLVECAPLAVKVASDLWDLVVVPWLKQRLGKDAVSKPDDTGGVPR